MLAHYENRLQTAYASHLRTCIALYQKAFNSAAWRAELGDMYASLVRIPQRRRAAYSLAGRSWYHLWPPPPPDCPEGQRVYELLGLVDRSVPAGLGDPPCVWCAMIWIAMVLGSR